MVDSCPICDVLLKKYEERDDRYFFECPRCGPYSLTGSANGALAWRLRERPDAALKLSYALYRMTKREAWAMLDSSMLGDIIANTELPLPQEQFENLIGWLGQSLPSIGSAVGMSEDMFSAIGVRDRASIKFLATHAIDAGYVSALVADYVSGDFALQNISLTMAGWSLFNELQRGVSVSKYAFIAMQFGREDLDKVVNECFRPAVAATGFELRRLDDSPSAGLIDDRLRVEIRQSRFLLADLTHHNKGAYWEAGYAEGLGKPVIYLCRKDVFEEKTQGTHFDTNHHLTVVWDPANLDEAVAKLKATIRATLPEEAKISD
jgi:hypothetical protein